MGAGISVLKASLIALVEAAQLCRASLDATLRYNELGPLYKDFFLHVSDTPSLQQKTFSEHKLLLRD